jgi:pullulanase/glycogen debranching enzyme
MSRAQRLTYLGIAAAIVVAAVIVLVVAGGGSNSSSDGAASRGVPLLTQATRKHLDHKQGDRVTFRVRVARADEVHVHGYDIERELKAGKPATISFKATITGVFDIELHNADVQIAELKVEPR